MAGPRLPSTGAVAHAHRPGGSPTEAFDRGRGGSGGGGRRSGVGGRAIAHAPLPGMIAGVCALPGRGVRSQRVPRGTREGSRTHARVMPREACSGPGGHAAGARARADETLDTCSPRLCPDPVTPARGSGQPDAAGCSSRSARRSARIAAWSGRAAPTSRAINASSRSTGEPSRLVRSCTRGSSRPTARSRRSIACARGPLRRSRYSSSEMTFAMGRTIAPRSDTLG